MKKILVLLVLLSALPEANLPAQPSAPGDDPIVLPESKADRDRRMRWWREARFGMFIHWGLYSIPAGTWNGKRIPGIGEWIMNKGKIPVADYSALAARFDPVKFNADAWVATAKAAGMKYIVITAKHHDGFAMFDSKADPYNIVAATPFKRDPLKELAAACSRQGIRLGFYYSQAQDWHAPGGSAYGGHWDKAQDGDFSAYIRTKAVPQLKELLTNYQPFPAVLWFDTPRDMTKKDADLILPLLRQHPDLIWNNRLGGGYLGDTETPEQRIPATGYPGDWESCMTMNDTWGYKSYDHNWKSPEELIRDLVDIASKGGNFLLNVGPTSEGEIPEASIERLHRIGTWLSANGQSIYRTTASPFQRLSWGRATSAPGRLYLHVFAWPSGGTLNVPMRGTPKRAYLLSEPGRLLPVSSSPAGLAIALPSRAPDAVDSVVVLDGVEEVGAFPPPPLRQTAGSPLVLLPDAGTLSGPDLRVEGAIAAVLTGWRSTADSVSWDVQITQAGAYRILLNCSVPAGEGGSAFSVSVGDRSVKGTTEETGDQPKVLDLGTLRVDRPEVVSVSIHASRIRGRELFALNSLELKPD